MSAAPRAPLRHPPMPAATEAHAGELAAVLAGWRLWQESVSASERTIADRARTIKNLVGFAGCGPLEITPAHIIGFMTRPGLTPGTRLTYHGAISAYSAYLVAAGLREDDPVGRVPKPRRRAGLPRPISEAQLQAVLAAANRRTTRMMILLAAFEGLRVHEIAKIRGDDFDLDAGLLYVVGKGAKEATLPVHPLVLAGAAGFPADGWWFPSPRNDGPIHRTAVGKTIHDTLARAGVHATPHQLRHYYGTALLRNGANLRVVQELMRHSSVATTALYTEVSDVQRRDAIAGLFAGV
ncbi:tyrosine-type recombinase/integrase [Arthrobacter wenxiniae]|uniref:Tyrosine-type recombinase/integrase n=1 Tax=Arthrobacter wenxiniae TaxID=2713570 RepID=A0A7Y7IG00_9MICC|nr:tyrosine-type recombinase/integrase [Arthrobacter wenxiniae]NVM94757.1 tyrosine-type recombinase/integrase [Arthrobacter wenxiniae]